MDNKSTQIGELQSILTSRTFYAIVDEHKKSLQKEINAFVEKQDLVNSFGALRAFRDADRLIRLMRNKLEELKK
jgi:hypothetical protein